MSASDIPIENLLRALRERAKELNCLYRIEESLKFKREESTGANSFLPPRSIY
jgi:hypothetical protein